jgi:carboxyl-terminal processing protease
VDWLNFADWFSNRREKKMKYKKIQSWLPLLLGVTMVLGMAGGYQLFRHMASPGLTLSRATDGSVQQALNLIRQKYVDSIQVDSLEILGIEAITNRLDPHSVFISKAQMEDVDADLTGSFNGIGVEYQMIRDTLMVTAVVKKGPAEEAGLLPGDAIYKVDTSIIAGRKLETRQLRDLLRGKGGTTVQVGVMRNGTSLTKKIVRGMVPFKSVDTYYMVDDSIGYIKINRFAETTFFEFMDAATFLQKNGMKEMILDLRGNTGGLLEEATKIADELLEDGLTIVTTRGNKTKEAKVIATKPGIFEEGKLVVLIDEQSASASEVLAGALQDNDRSTTTGRRSFGKGLVQEQYMLGNGGALRLTVARYFTPLGRSIQKSYVNGNQEYKGEIYHRTNQSGNSNTQDTAGKKVFYTRKGKALYEAGGITPDIAIPYDTTVLPRSMIQFYASPLFDEITFDYYRQSRAAMQQMKTPQSFDSAFSLQKEQWEQLYFRANADSIRLAGLKPGETKMIESRIKAQLARYRWGNEGLYKLVNQNDPAFRKAIDFLKMNKS